MSDVGGDRHLARERALEIAYEASIKERSIDVVLEELPLRPDGYSVLVLGAFAEHRAWAERLVAEHADGWDFDRMPMVDRLVMTMALCELRLDEHPPRAVVLDEYVELAKTFSTDASPGFVNGVLSACLNTLDNQTAN